MGLSHYAATAQAEPDFGISLTNGVHNNPAIGRVRIHCYGHWVKSAVLSSRGSQFRYRNKGAEPCRIVFRAV